MIRKYIILLLTAEILSIGHLLSQPILEWENVYHESNSYTSSSFALALDDSGNVYITGLEEINQVFIFTVYQLTAA